jgi:glutathione S-transferase
MKLYSAALSLFARKVEVVLAEKNLAFERVMVPFTQSHGYSPKHPDVLEINPKGQVPVLIDQGLRLYDSTVIVEYLEEAYPEPALFPSTPGDRAQCRQFELFADEVFLLPVRALMHRTGPRPADPHRWTELEAAAEQAALGISACFRQLDQQLADRAFLCGGFSIADIAMFMPVLYSQRLAGPSLLPHQALGTWYRRLRERPAFAGVVAEIVAADLALSSPVAGAYR